MTNTRYWTLCGTSGTWVRLLLTHGWDISATVSSVSKKLRCVSRLESGCPSPRELPPGGAPPALEWPVQTLELPCCAFRSLGEVVHPRPLWKVLFGTSWRQLRSVAAAPRTCQRVTWRKSKSMNVTLKNTKLWECLLLETLAGTNITHYFQQWLQREHKRLNCCVFVKRVAL